MNFSLNSRKYLVCTLNRNTPIIPNEKNFSLDPTLFFSLTLRDAANRPQKFSKKLSPQKKKKNLNCSFAMPSQATLRSLQDA